MAQEYNEVREDFIDGFNFILEERDKGEELELIAQGTPFEHFALKGEGTLFRPSIPMELAYANCRDMDSDEMTEAFLQILEMNEDAELISKEELEQIDNIVIFPVSLTKYQDKLEENNIAFMPYQDMAAIFQFYMEKDTFSYCRDVTKAHLDIWGLSVQELFEIVRYKEIEVTIENQYDALMEDFANDKSIILKPAGGVPEELKEMYQVYGMNGFGVIWYPRVMEQMHEKLGSEMLIIPDDIYRAYIQAPSLLNTSELQLRLQDGNESKEIMGEGRHVLSEQIFKYDMETKNLVPAVEPKIADKHKMR